MSYVDAFHNRERDVIHVAERVNGKRLLIELPADYTFYVADPKGKKRSIHGEPVTEVRCRTHKEFKRNLGFAKGTRTFESDIKPISKVISTHYNNVEPPTLNTAFFDIEVDFDPLRGYASPDEAFMPITSISVYLQWLDVVVCLAVPPPTLSWEQAQDMVSHMPDVILFRREHELLDTFLSLIDDADVLSGWNSEGYDIPYTVNRIIQTLGKQETRRLCLWDLLPDRREYESYGKTAVTYDLCGRVHLDYLQLYRKYNYEERHSYTLDFIAEMELGEKKVPYEGSLDQLYRNDFVKFLEYNIQDSVLLNKLDIKLQFIDLANSIAHDNTVLLPVTMGVVATTEQAIINEAHRRDMVIPDRTRVHDAQAVGGYVAVPKRGYHRWVGSMDINSLYPSVFRALNMSPETLVGQVSTRITDHEIMLKMTGQWIDPDTGKPQGKKKMPFTDAWNNKFCINEYDLIMSRDTRHTLTLSLEDGSSHEMTGAQLYTLIFDSGLPWCITANGTIFKTDVDGVIPSLFARWYSERKELQAKKATAKDPKEESFWDKRQLVKKINLNASYGAILNVGCRFFDQRIGQSTTLTGRSITRHMCAETNRMLTGEYQYDGICIVYSDTDSTYFSAVPVLEKDQELDLEGAVALYDHISTEVSNTFPQYMTKAFGVHTERGKLIKAGREVVGQAGLFITKKRYAIKCLDIEGKRKVKLKIMGMDIKRSDTPKFIQEFLEKLLDDALSGVPEKEVVDQIIEFKTQFQQMDPWLKGMPKRVNNLTPYTEKYMSTRALHAGDFLNRGSQKEHAHNMIPGHVTASIHWNLLRTANSDNYSMLITDGMKVIVCRLKPNAIGYDNIAYPTDEKQLPEWFKTLPFDDDGMEEAVLTKKIQNVLGAMNWDLDRARRSQAFNDFFEF